MLNPVTFFTIRDYLPTFCADYTHSNRFYKRLSDPKNTQKRYRRSMWGLSAVAAAPQHFASIHINRLFRASEQYSWANLIHKLFFITVGRYLVGLFKQQNVIRDNIHFKAMMSDLLCLILEPLMVFYLFAPGLWRCIEIEIVLSRYTSVNGITRPIGTTLFLDTL